jgi:hypothetical protein
MCTELQMFCTLRDDFDRMERKWIDATVEIKRLELKLEAAERKLRHEQERNAARR